MSHCRWNLLPPVTVLPEKDGSSGYSPLLVQLLYNRGINRPEDFPAFLASDRSLMGDPFLLAGMEQAVIRINRALLSGETIGIYGDFDADGITATAVLVQGLSLLGGKAVPYIPHRQTEGHGLTTAVLKKLHEQGVSLVITVDCGITDVAEVKKAMKMGLDIIITDHHSPLEEIPEAFAVINPKLTGSAYPFTNLAGVGVAFKLLQALFRSLGKEEQIDSRHGPGSHRHHRRYVPAAGGKPLPHQRRTEKYEHQPPPRHQGADKPDPAGSRQPRCRQHFLGHRPVPERRRPAGGRADRL